MTLIEHPELYWLAATAAMTGLMWLPYIVSLIVQTGLGAALTDPNGGLEPERSWAGRAKRAHGNAVENLVVFAPLALSVHVLGVGDGATALAAKLYFIARVGHYAVYTLGAPVVRTLIFALGVACQAVLALRLFGLI